MLKKTQLLSLALCLVLLLPLLSSCAPKKPKLTEATEGTLFVKSTEAVETTSAESTTMAAPLPAAKETAKPNPNVKTYPNYKTLYEVNMRADASTDAQVVTVLKLGALLTQTGEKKDNWIPVSYGTDKGYVREDLVEKVEESSSSSN